MTTSPRLLILGAHPDDSEFHAGGLAARYRARGHEVKMVSVTDGGAGHHRLAREELVQLRREEAAAAGNVIGAASETWDFPDGALRPTLEVRERIIREIRLFAPDLVLTHRTCDYHPDHRAVGQAVQDASYLVTVPLVLPDVPHLRRDPVVAYMVDLFTKPCPFEPHVLLDIEAEMPRVVEMLACHRSQVFDWLPYNHAVDPPPDDESSRREWLTAWCETYFAPRVDRFRTAIDEHFDAERAGAVRWLEAYEISEYASGVDGPERARLFPAD